ncbi:tetratricopeptide repeat protein [Nostoc sp.]|uniref:tetratricopeptide repeat protein n=1 Tax=Nostoc sp. TaxID=1180 RepID=UPI002FFB1AD0
MNQSYWTYRFFAFTNWFNRERVTLLIGSILLLLGAIYPWYRLPPETLEAFGTNLFWANAVRVPLALCAIAGFTYTFVFHVRQAPRLVFWGALIPILLFPYFITTWSPAVSFIAAEYYNQGEKVSSHVDKNFSEVQAQWKQNIVLDNPDVPTSSFGIKIEDSRFFQLPSWDKVILEGFGYKNSFFAFIGQGWSFSLIGVLICLMALYLACEQQGINSLTKDMKILMPVSLLLFSAILGSHIYFNIVNYQLNVQFAKGEYSQVVNTSQVLTKLYPPLQGDEEFLERLARAELYTNVPEPGLINFIQGLENYKDSNFLEAENYFQTSLEIQPNRFLVRGYLVAATLNRGVNYFNEPNTRNAGTAADIFEQSFSIFPGHVEALYDLMLARVVNGEFQKSAEVAKKIIDGQKYFQEPGIGLMGQAYVHLTWDEYNKGNISKTWERYRQSVNTKAWDESGVEE